MSSLSILCIASFHKGDDFLRAAKKTGSTVYLVTSKKHEHKPWAREAIDEIFFVQDDEKGNWNMDEVLSGLAWLMQAKRIDRIVALDDFDVEKAALMREHFRVPGMGQTTARYFRDKLAMRMKAQDAGINVPAFSSLFHDADIHAYTQRVPAPWVVKPRSEASATGIKKVYSAEELWDVLNIIGADRHHYLIEQFKPGAVYHADALTQDGNVLFCRVSQYVNTPFEVAHGGGIFRSATVDFGSKDDKELQKMNAQVMKAFGMQYSASHTEFIRCHDDDKYYFLETASRVGGANLAEMVEYSSGLNLWAEWAKLEVAVANGEKYELPKIKNDHAGIVVSLARDQYPDTSRFQNPEICWRMNMEHHIGMIVHSETREQILSLLDDFATVIFRDFHASAPAPDKPSH